MLKKPQISNTSPNTARIFKKPQTTKNSVSHTPMNKSPAQVSSLRSVEHLKKFKESNVTLRIATNNVDSRQ
jgi:hypothetical protein